MNLVPGKPATIASFTQKLRTSSHRLTWAASAYARSQQASRKGHSTPVADFDLSLGSLRKLGRTLDRGNTLVKLKQARMSIELRPLGNYTVRDALVHVAQHNSHHLGQDIAPVG
jgi:uncharacterized damage-inducible protein DinB